MAAIFGHLGHDDLGLDIYKCGAYDPISRIYPCKKTRCCPFCAAVAGYKERRERAARVLLALEANPNLALYYMTLTTHSDPDFEKQVKSLLKRMNKLLRSKKGSWSKVRGIIWWIEPARGAGGKWRSHIHAIVAFDQRTAPRNPRCLIQRWANDHRSELPDPWPREGWESDRKYKDIIKHQDIQPLHCYKQSPLSSRVVASCNPVALLFDVMNLAEYSRTDRRQNSSKPGKRVVPMTPDDRAHITLLSPKLRGCKGVFYGVNSDDRESLEKQLTEIDRSPSLRRQLYDDALRSPSNASTMVPRPKRSLTDEGTEEPRLMVSRPMTPQRKSLPSATEAWEMAARGVRRPHRVNKSRNTLFRRTVASLRGLAARLDHSSRYNLCQDASMSPCEQRERATRKDSRKTGSQPYSIRPCRIHTCARHVESLDTVSRNQPARCKAAPSHSVHWLHRA